MILKCPSQTKHVTISKKMDSDTNYRVTNVNLYAKEELFILIQYTLN